MPETLKVKHALVQIAGIMDDAPHGDQGHTPLWGKVKHSKTAE
jgi:hypothetical protein